MPSLTPLRRVLFLATTIPISRTTAFLQQSASVRQTKTSWFSSKSRITEDQPRESILNRSPKEDEEIIVKTLDWLQRTVIGLNLCPFAEKPFNKKQINLEVIHGSDQVEIMASVLAECLVRQNRPGTSLIICPDLFPKNFLAYLEIYNMIQDGVLVENDLTHSIQVAPFHPFFEFEGSGESIDNFTNRSPFPLFHVLREEEVSRAVDALQGDSERVWKRNIQLLEELETELGRETTKEIFSGMEADAATNEKIDAVMRRLKRTSQDDGLDGTTL